MGAANLRGLLVVRTARRDVSCLYPPQGVDAGRAARRMFERFTNQARHIVVLAQEEARMLNQDYIGTEHILLALIHESTGTAARALESTGITEEAACQQVQEIIGRGQQDPPRGHIPFIPRAEKTLELSLREAIALGNNFIGSEHILLGMIREGDNPATQIMNRLDVEPNRVRQEVIRRVHAQRVVEEPAVRRAAPRGPNRKLLPELYGRLDSLEWRMSVLEQRVGIGPDIRDLDREITQVRRDKGSRHRRPGLRGRRRAARQGKPAAHRQGRPGTGVGSPPVSERGDRAAS